LKKVPCFAFREREGFGELIYPNAVSFQHLKIGKCFQCWKIELAFEKLSDLALVDWLALERARNGHKVPLRVVPYFTL